MATATPELSSYVVTGTELYCLLREAQKMLELLVKGHDTHK